MASCSAGLFARRQGRVGYQRFATPGPDRRCGVAASRSGYARASIASRRRRATVAWSIRQAHATPMGGARLRGFVYLAVVVSTGSAAACCHGGCRSPWTRHSASRHWRMRWRVTASPTSLAPTKVRSSLGRPSLACLPATALRARKHSSIRPCCPSRPQRTWDLHQTLLG